MFACSLLIRFFDNQDYLLYYKLIICEIKNTTKGILAQDIMKFKISGIKDVYSILNRLGPNTQMG